MYLLLDLQFKMYDYRKRSARWQLNPTKRMFTNVIAPALLKLIFIFMRRKLHKSAEIIFAILYEYLPPNIDYPEMFKEAWRSSSVPLAKTMFIKGFPNFPRAMGELADSISTTRNYIHPELMNLYIMSNNFFNMLTSRGQPFKSITLVIPLLIDVNVGDTPGPAILRFLERPVGTGPWHISVYEYEISRINVVTLAFKKKRIGLALNIMNRYKVPITNRIVYGVVASGDVQLAKKMLDINGWASHRQISDKYDPDYGFHLHLIHSKTIARLVFLYASIISGNVEMFEYIRFHPKIGWQFNFVKLVPGAQIPYEILKVVAFKNDIRMFEHIRKIRNKYGDPIIRGRKGLYFRDIDKLVVSRQYHMLYLILLEDWMKGMSGARIIRLLNNILNNYIPSVHMRNIFLIILKHFPVEIDRWIGSAIRSNYPAIFRIIQDIPQLFTRLKPQGRYEYYLMRNMVQPMLQELDRGANQNHNIAYLSGPSMTLYPAYTKYDIWVMAPDAVLAVIKHPQTRLDQYPQILLRNVVRYGVRSPIVDYLLSTRQLQVILRGMTSKPTYHFHYIFGIIAKQKNVYMAKKVAGFRFIKIERTQDLLSKLKFGIYPAIHNNFLEMFIEFAKIDMKLSYSLDTLKSVVEKNARDISIYMLRDGSIQKLIQNSPKAPETSAIFYAALKTDNWHVLNLFVNHPVLTHIVTFNNHFAIKYAILRGSLITIRILMRNGDVRRELQKPGYFLLATLGTGPQFNAIRVNVDKDIIKTVKYTPDSTKATEYYRELLKLFLSNGVYDINTQGNLIINIIQSEFRRYIVMLNVLMDFVRVNTKSDALIRKYRVGIGNIIQDNRRRYAESQRTIRK